MTFLCEGGACALSGPATKTSSERICPHPHACCRHRHSTAVRRGAVTRPLARTAEGISSHGPRLKPIAREVSRMCGAYLGTVASVPTIYVPVFSQSIDPIA